MPAAFFSPRRKQVLFSLSVSTVLLAAYGWMSPSAKAEGDGSAKPAEAKPADSGDLPAYTKRGPFAEGAKHPHPCDHWLHLPLLVPQASYDLKEYCGGGISLF